MQDRFRVTVGLATTFKDEIAGRLESEALRKIGRHRAVMHVGRVLLIYDRGHSLEGLANLGFTAEAVAQPIGHVLARNTQGSAIFHQTNIINVRDL